MKLNWDAMGIATSVACAIHCALLPILLTSLPILGFDIIHNAVFEWTMIFIAIIVGIYALYHGYKTHHQNIITLLIFGIGALFLMLKQFFLSYEYLFLSLAVCFIISAHVYNYKLCQQKKCNSPHHKHS